MMFQMSWLLNKRAGPSQGELQGMGPPQICVGDVFPQGALQHNVHDTQLSGS